MKNEPYYRIIPSPDNTFNSEDGEELAAEC